MYLKPIPVDMSVQFINSTGIVISVSFKLGVSISGLFSKIFDDNLYPLIPRFDVTFFSFINTQLQKNSFGMEIE